MKNKISSQGFTLMELLLVMVIISSIIFMSVGYMNQRTLQMRVDRTVVQMQQILNAGLSYYVNNGSWPANLAALQPTYIPSGIASPWGGGTYSVSSTQPQLLSVATTLPATMTNRLAVATLIAGRLPLATSSSGTVTAVVNVPGQNLNNASAVNFAGLYHHGACVPVPNCPSGMTAQIFVVPASVKGVNDEGSRSLYPITSFTAYAIGGSDNSPGGCKRWNDVSTAVSCLSNNNGPVASKYWRVCMQIITSKAELSVNSQLFGSSQTLLAVTRCSIPGEAQGSNFNVYSN